LILIADIDPFVMNHAPFKNLEIDPIEGEMTHLKKHELHSNKGIAYVELEKKNIARFCFRSSSNIIISSK